MLTYAQMIEFATETVAKREKAVPLDEVKELEKSAPAPRDGLGALRSVPGKVAIMAEIKRGSPATGPIAPVEDPGALAKEYVRGGAAALSVVTEPYGYGGRLADLDAVRAAVDLPLLRKELVVCPYQIHEARAHGADLVLLVAGLLTPLALESLIERTESLGMEALVECHTRYEARLSIAAGAKAIGINARDLETGDIDRSNLEQVIDVIPPQVMVIAESGVRGPRDVFEYARVGADAVLIGQALVCSTDPAQLLAAMVAAGMHPALRRDRRSRYRSEASEATPN